MQNAIYFDENLIQIPDITELTTILFDLVTIDSTVFFTPLPDRFIADNDASSSEQSLNITKAQCKSMIKPPNFQIRGKLESVFYLIY